MPRARLLRWALLRRTAAARGSGSDRRHAGRRRRGNGMIAVIGLACRLPGASDPEAFWNLLCGGASAIGPVPRGRWDDIDRNQAVGRGGFLPEIDRFDAAFFGVSPGEAAAMDPQQRLMLELSWEAVERARILPGALRNRRLGVFLGAISDDYAMLAHDRGAGAIGQYSVTGTQRSMLANRVSHFLGGDGPSMVVDA